MQENFNTMNTKLIIFNYQLFIARLLCIWDANDVNLGRLDSIRTQIKCVKARLKNV